MTVTDKHEEWAAPADPGPLPDTTGWSVDRLETLALERCGPEGRKHTLRTRGGGSNEKVACRSCLQEALTGKNPLAVDGGPVDIAVLLAQFPPPDKGFGKTHRALLEALADRGRRDLRDLQQAVTTSDGEPLTETNLSARLRDLRQFGYPIGRKMEGGRPLYWLAV
jgi:hypothetical protein